MFDMIVVCMRLPDIRRRILVTVGVMVAFVAVTNIPLPGVPYSALANLSSNAEAILELLEITAGNALSPFSIVAVGLPVYALSSSHVWLGLQAAKRLNSERDWSAPSIGPKVHFIFALLVIPESLILGHLLIWVVFGPDVLFLKDYGDDGARALVGLMRAFAIVAGAMFTFWLLSVERQKGIGTRGFDVLVFTGIVTLLPVEVANVLNQRGFFGILGMVIPSILVVVFLIFLLEGQRRIPVQYGRRVIGRRIYPGQSMHFSIKVLPIDIDAIKTLLVLLLLGVLPIYIISEAAVGRWQEIASSIYQFLRPDRLPFYLLVALILPFHLIVHSEIAIRENNPSETLQRQGGFIPAIRPGLRTELYIRTIARRIYIPAAIALTLLFLLAVLLAQFFETSLLDVLVISFLVSLIIDRQRYLESLTMLRHLPGFLMNEPTGDSDQSTP